MKYGDRLKELRNKKSISQQELADRLKINRSTYARYETSTTQPDYETLEKLADFFEVTTDYILGRTDKVHKTNIDSFDPIEEIRKITKELGIRDLAFYDIEEWKNFTREDVEDLAKQFEWIAEKAKKRKEDN